MAAPKPGPPLREGNISLPTQESQPAPPKPKPDPRIGILGLGGIVNPSATIVAAQAAKLPLPYACALLEKESAGGLNLWGHDPTIFVGGYDAAHSHAYGSVVTQEAYRAYLRQRGPQGRGGMQGVGPCQLTWYSYQDQADTLGGCWLPVFNMTVGFRLLEANIARDGEQAGAAAYNGSGPAAEAYGDDFVAKAAVWKARLAVTPPS